MRRLIAAAVFGLVMTLSVPAYAEDIREGSAFWATAQTLIANERTAWEVYQRRDTSAPDLLTPDYVEVLEGGEVNGRAAHLAMIAEADLPSYALDAFVVTRLTDEAMIVTYEADWTDSAGEAGRLAVTSGWAVRGGSWMNVFYRETPLP